MAPTRPMVFLWLVFVVCVGAISCDVGEQQGQNDNAADASSEDAAGANDSRESSELAVMSFNVWYGGNAIDFNQVGAAIRAADADVVGLQEPEANARKIANEAGLPYVDESLHLISRYPLYAAERDGIRFAYVAVDPGHVAAITNVHLTCCPYGPHRIRDGKPAENAIELEREVRLPEIEPYLDPLSGLADEGVPVFLTGDMNAPSHLDWTEETAASREQVKFPVQWPVSKALEDAGIRDSYREAHPDPVAHPGLTWTPGTPPPIIRAGESLDRIDYVMASGPAETLDSRVVGEKGGPDVGVGISPWPSDHRAVVSDFEITPAPNPALVGADPRVVEKGERVTVRYTLPDAEENRAIGILPGDGSDEPIFSLPIYRGADHLTAMFATNTLKPGEYRAALLDSDGSAAATSPFWVLEEDAQPRIEVARPTLTPDEPVEVSWSNAPGNKLDWVGIYKAGDADTYNYYGFLYIGAKPEGKIEFSKSDLYGGLEPGEYEARLMLDDGYAVLASARFTVAANSR